jgi:hypothetical protein
MITSRATEYLASRGLPTHDAVGLEDSTHRFDDGASFRIEVPTINNPTALESMIKHTTQFGITVNRISITYGVMRYLDSEIRDMLSIASENGIEAFMMVGPRAILDIGAQAHINTLNPHHVAYRLRGTDALSYGLEDAFRAIDLGCRGIIACDEGLLYALNDMRSAGEVPADLQLKASVLLGVSNILSFRRIEEAGADSINIQRDMPLTMIGGFRLASALPMDIHANNPDQTGGFVRTYDVPEMVRVASPVYIKTGNVAVSHHSIMVDDGAGYRMAREAALTVQHIKKYLPDAVQTEAGHASLAVPAVQSVSAR